MPSEGTFPVTRWTLVARARQSGAEGRGAIEELCRDYWFPIYAFLRRRGYSQHDAEDWTQGFFQELLDDGLFQVAAADRGRLRSLLLSGLERFIADRLRHDHAQKRGGGVPSISIEWARAEERSFAEPVDERSTNLFAATVATGVRSCRSGRKYFFCNLDRGAAVLQSEPMKTPTRFPSIERLEDRIAPASFMVTNLLDDGSPGSLRKAMDDANTTDGPDTITLKVTGTLTLALGGLYFDDGVTIKGPGSTKLTISGGGIDRIFAFSNVQTDDPISVSGLTLTNAGANVGDGRAIYSSEPTSLTDVKVIANTAPNAGTTKGGGVFIQTEGNITIKNCLFSGNGGAEKGGGAYLSTTGASSKIAISGSTFEGNSAELQGGGLWIASSGGAASLTVDHSTFTGNGTTLGSGGGLRVSSAGGLTTVKGSLFSANSAGVGFGGLGGGFVVLGGSLLVQDTKLIHNAANTGGGVAYAGSSFTAKNAEFAFNAAYSPNLNFNEGGGALNLDGVTAYKITGGKFTANQALAEGGALSIRTSSGEISGATFRANSSDNVGGALFLKGTGTALVKGGLFSANHADYGGAIYKDTTALTIAGARFTANLATLDGGALYAISGGATVSGSTFDHNTSLGAGGAVALNTSFVSLSSVYRDNYAAGSGGAIAIPSGGINFTLKGGSVTDNRAGGAGGGLFLSNPDSLLVEKVLISDNHATGNGGGVNLTTNFAVSVTFTGNTIRDNTTSSASFGGGLYLTGIATVVLTKNKIIGNFAGNGGGGFTASPITATDNTIEGNFALTNPDFGV